MERIFAWIGVLVVATVAVAAMLDVVADNHW
jgi:hypothetical protein